MIEIPVKGLFCKHLTCMDLKRYSETTGAKCLICNAGLSPNHLVIDGLLLEIISTRPKGRRVRFKADGSWEVVVVEEDMDTGM